jgi:hypothetical protein
MLFVGVVFGQFAFVAILILLGTLIPHLLLLIRQSAPLVARRLQSFPVNILDDDCCLELINDTNSLRAHGFGDPCTILHEEQEVRSELNVIIIWEERDILLICNLTGFFGAFGSLFLSLAIP